MTTPQLHQAKIDWDAQGQPLSTEFTDVYFSKQSGLDESRYVFIQHNQLTERFQQIANNNSFVVAETGFGTGLNFLACWQHFLQYAPQQARLHFISVEKHPLCVGDLQQALALWPELEQLSTQLLQQYMVIQPGYQHFIFQQGRVCLTLLIGEACEQLNQLDTQVDAWFLDGFAPSKNPEMWSEALFGQLARLAKPQTTLATFTSAGFVRRGLQAVGFNIQRHPGFGHKREMLSGTFCGSHTVDWMPPWFARPAQPANPEKHAVVIGAGISGCASAYSLAIRGWQVTLIERNQGIAQEASGNPQGILYLKLSAHQTNLTQLILSGFGFSRRLLTHWPDNPHFGCSGLLQLAYNALEQKRQPQLATAFTYELLRPVTAQQASELAGVPLTMSALFYPESGWIQPAELCRLLTMHENIKLLTGQQVTQLDYKQQQWHVQAEHGCIAQAPVVIIANANQAKNFSQTASLPIKPIHGQVTSVPATQASLALNTVLSAEGYIAPQHESQHCLGASFDFQRTDTQLTSQDQQGNLQRLQDISSALYDKLDAHKLDPEQLAGHAALRCTGPDHMPIVGPVADFDELKRRYNTLGKDARMKLDAPCPWYPGLYVNTGHGSRGMITAPLAGEQLAAWINNEAQVLPRTLLEACHPNRFAIKILMRKKPYYEPADGDI